MPPLGESDSKERIVSDKVDIKIRRMVEDDLAAVNDVDLSITGRGRVTTWPFPFQTYWEIFKPDAIVFVAELNGEVSGFLSGYIEPQKRSKSLLERPHEAVHSREQEYIGWIEMMGIKPESWHKGIGSRLIDAFRAECRKKNAQLRIVARDDDNELAAFLRTAGFKKSQFVTYEMPS